MPLISCIRAIGKVNVSFQSWAFLLAIYVKPNRIRKIGIGHASYLHSVASAIKKEHLRSGVNIITLRLITDVRLN